MARRSAFWTNGWKTAVVLTTGLFLGGCVVSYYKQDRSTVPAPKVGEWSAVELADSTDTVRIPPPEQLPDTLYYADLGNAAIDVSSYPIVQQDNYKTFARVCAQCHTLARAVNSPTQSGLYWRFHLARMSVHSRFAHMGPLSPDEKAAILDFLEYDGHIRKVEHKKEFDAQTEELKRRFDPIYERLLQNLLNAYGRTRER